MLDTLQQVGDKAVEAALVDDSTTHALRNFDGGLLCEIPLGGALGHRVERPHPAVLLQTNAILEEICAWRFFRPSK